MIGNGTSQQDEPLQYWVSYENQLDKEYKQNEIISEMRVHPQMPNEVDPIKTLTTALDLLK